MRVKRLLVLCCLGTFGLVPVSGAAEPPPDRCELDPSIARYAARVAEVPEVSRSRSAVVLCDHRTGVERRGRTLRLNNARGGEAFLAAAASEGQVAWIEATYTRTSARVVLVEASTPSLASERRRLLYAGRIPLGSAFGVVFTRGGTLVYSTPGGVRVGERRVVVGPVASLGIEDGKTLRFNRRATGKTYLDLSPPARDRTGCPVRERFRRTYVTSEVVLTRASYGGDDSYNQSDVWRACIPGSGRDPVVSVTTSAPSSPTGPLLGVDAPWVLTGGTDTDKYHSCTTTMRAVDTRTGTRGPVSYADSCDPLLSPIFGDPVAITDRGRFAWLKRSPDAWRLQLASGPRETTATLQAGPPGTISAPTASGPTIQWSTSDPQETHTITPG